VPQPQSRIRVEPVRLRPADAWWSNGVTKARNPRNQKWRASACAVARRRSSIGRRRRIVSFRRR